MKPPAKKCKLCKKIVRGRSDKLFCTISCKSIYHNKLKKVTEDVSSDVDKILHRNRSILLEILGKRTTQKMIPKFTLDKKKFNYSFITGTHVNKQGKRVFNIYDFSYLVFSTQDVLIVRNKNYLNPPTII